MKTLREPRSPSVYRFTCTNRKCHAEMEADESEGKPWFDQRDNESGYTFSCPYCGTMVSVSEKSGRLT